MDIERPREPPLCQHETCNRGQLWAVLGELLAHALNSLHTNHNFNPAQKSHSLVFLCRQASSYSHIISWFKPFHSHILKICGCDITAVAFFPQSHSSCCLSKDRKGGSILPYRILFNLLKNIYNLHKNITMMLLGTDYSKEYFHWKMLFCH